MNLNWKLMYNSLTWKDKYEMIKFIVKSNHFTNGKKVIEFENEWNKWLGCKYSLFVSSGSTANFLLVDTIKEKYNFDHNTKVLLPACTWPTNVSPIIQLGMKPIFSDINLENFSFDETSLYYISKSHPDIKMVFVTHLLGYFSDLNIVKKYFPNAIIIEDACEATGTLNYYEGNKVGSNSLGCTFSTYFGHHFSTLAEGGFVTTNDEELYDLMKMKRCHGMARVSKNYNKYAESYDNIDKLFLFMTHGYNFRNSELPAVVGLQQLKKLDKIIEIRKRNYKLFHDIIEKYHWLFYSIRYESTASNFCLPFICRTELICKNLKSIFDQYGIEYRPIVGGNLLEQPFLKKYQIEMYNSLGANFIHNGLYIGNNQFITEKHLNQLDKILGEI